MHQSFQRDVATPKLSVFQAGSRLEQQLRQAVISSKVAVPWSIFKKSSQLPGKICLDKLASTQHILPFSMNDMNEYRYCQNLPDVYRHTSFGQGVYYEHDQGL